MSPVPNPIGTRGLLLDAMGTMVRLIPPAPVLTRALAASGYPNSEDRVRAAMRVEIAYYRRHHLDGRTPAAVAGLRRACADVLARELAVAPPVDQLTELLLEALRFEAYPEVVPVLGALRGRGVRVAVVSDWDCTLAEHLVRLGIREWVDAVVVSAVVGVTKPDQRIFTAALAELGVTANGALMCGDDPARDLAGARAAGIRGVLIDRHGRHPDVAPRVGTLTELAEWL
jgi:putative hydrolase of the HAD superfamily